MYLKDNTSGADFNTAVGVGKLCTNNHNSI